MNPPIFEHLSRAIAGRSAAVATSLQPGLSEAEIRRTLHDVGVPGVVEPVVALYAWRNGVKVEPEAPLCEFSLFPNTDFQILPFQPALRHYCRFAGMSQEFAHLFTVFR